MCSLFNIFKLRAFLNCRCIMWIKEQLIVAFDIPYWDFVKALIICTKFNAYHKNSKIRRNINTRCEYSIWTQNYTIMLSLESCKTLNYSYISIMPSECCWENLQTMGQGILGNCRRKYEVFTVVNIEAVRHWTWAAILITRIKHSVNVVKMDISISAVT